MLSSLVKPGQSLASVSGRKTLSKPPAVHLRQPARFVRHPFVSSSPLVRKACAVVASATTDAPSFSSAASLPVNTNGEPTQYPSSAGVYAVYSKDGKLQFIGISRKMSISIAGHMNDVPELSHSIKYAIVEDDSRENLTSIWKLWVEAAVAETGDIPPGNAPGDTKWRSKPKQVSRPEIKLTAGKGITGVTVEQLIDQVVKTNNVVAFVKGTRNAPQCGFSAKLISIMTENQANFEVVNVLDEFYNPGLREAIKAYSQWPTIPQLYIKGEFVGGCDIVEQMHLSGELKKALTS